MKNLLFILILIFFATFSIIAQSPCPSISITAPKELVKIGDSMTFTAKIDGINLENLKYQWKITNGTISSGQETLSINVATTKDMAGMTITAMFEVSGLPQNCSNEFNNSGEIEPQTLFCGLPITFDEYKNISWQKEKIKLDELAKELKKNEELGAFFRISIKQKNNSLTFKNKKLRIENYLIEKHKISKDKIVIANGGNDENLTRIVFIPPGVELPN